MDNSNTVAGPTVVCRRHHILTVFISLETWRKKEIDLEISAVIYSIGRDKIAGFVTFRSTFLRKMNAVNSAGRLSFWALTITVTRNMECMSQKLRK